MKPRRKQALAAPLVTTSLLVACAMFPPADEGEAHDLQVVYLDQFQATTQTAQVALARINALLAAPPR